MRKSLTKVGIVALFAAIMLCPARSAADKREHKHEAEKEARHAAKEHHKELLENEREYRKEVREAEREHRKAAEEAEREAWKDAREAERESLKDAREAEREYLKDVREREREAWKDAREGRGRGPVVFGPREIEIIVDFFRGQPGHRADLPPGIEKRLRRGGSLPPGLRDRVEPLPPDLARRLPPPPPGAHRGRIGTRVVVYDPKTAAILDAVAIAAEVLTR